MPSNTLAPTEMGTHHKQVARFRRECMGPGSPIEEAPFARRSLALNAIERGRAWHWRLLPAGWANTTFILRHGQIKTKRAFATFFPRAEAIIIQPKRTMKVKMPPPKLGELTAFLEELRAINAAVARELARAEDGDMGDGAEID